MSLSHIFDKKKLHTRIVWKKQIKQLFRIPNITAQQLTHPKTVVNTLQKENF